MPTESRRDDRSFGPQLGRGRPNAGRGSAAFAILAALGALLAAALWIPAPSRAEEPALLSLDPSGAGIVVDEEVTLTVRVREVVNLYGIDLRLAFDTATLEVVDADPAKEGIQSTPGAYPYPDLVARNEADNAAGTIWYMVTQLGDREAVSGEGTVATIRLRAKGAGTGAVTVRQADLASNEGMMIPVETADATLTVTAAPNEDEAVGASAGSPQTAAAAGAVVVAAAGALLLARRRRGP